ncbi:MAG: DUF503 domain-containing protein [Myxococcota bacterium]
MFIGVSRIVLTIPGARSLKDKRRVVHAFRDRVRARLSVSIAEVGELELYQRATLGAAVVARDSAHCSSLLSDVERAARGLREAWVSDVATEVIPMGPGGASLGPGIEHALDSASLDIDSAEGDSDEPPDDDHDDDEEHR